MSNDVDLLTNLPGFRDFYPEYWREINYILNKMRAVSLKYGYDEYEGPSLELVALIEAKSGEALLKEIFQLTDRGNRRLLLRPEQTPTLARMLAKEQQRYKRPIRWFSIPRLFRDETVQKGRLREFWQLNVDILGEDRVVADAETLAVAIDIVRACGLKDEQFNVYVNHRELLSNYISSITDINPELIIPVIDRKMSILQEETGKLLMENGMDKNSAGKESLLLRRIVNSSGSFKSKLVETASEDIIQLMDNIDEFIKTGLKSNLLKLGLNEDEASKLIEFVSLQNHSEEFFAKIDSLNLPDTCQPAIDELKEFTTYLEGFGVLEPVIFDTSMARGLDYYTGIVYESFDATGEIVRAIFGGGRYADLVEVLGGSPLSGVGFGMGELVLLELTKLNNLLPDDIQPGVDLYLAPIKKKPIPELLKLARKLRNNYSVICNPFPWKLPRHIENADNLGATLMLILGPKDLDQNVVSVRVIESGENLTLPMDGTLAKELGDLLAN